MTNPTDIVQRLRELASLTSLDDEDRRDLFEAADEIERLRSRVADLHHQSGKGSMTNEIKRAEGYVTDDGRMFATLDEAAEHKYSKDLKAAIGNKASGVFGVRTILEYSEAIEPILAAYNRERRRLVLDSFSVSTPLGQAKKDLQG